MSAYERLSNDSEVHKATKSGSSISISPIDQTLEGLQRFQPIAREALKHESDGEYTVQTAHESSTAPVKGLYDFLVLVLEKN